MRLDAHQHFWNYDPPADGWMTDEMNWPVCTLSGSYAATMDLAADDLAPFSEGVREAVLGGNCARFYLR